MFSHCQREENAVEKFIRQFNDRISGVISCFDRILFKGYLPIGWADAMERLLMRQGLLIKDFKQFVMKHQRPFHYINGRLRKEDFARQIAEQDGMT